MTSPWEKRRTWTFQAWRLTCPYCRSLNVHGEMSHNSNVLPWISPSHLLRPPSFSNHWSGFTVHGSYQDKDKKDLLEFGIPQAWRVGEVGKLVLGDCAETLSSTWLWYQLKQSGRKNEKLFEKQRGEWRKQQNGGKNANTCLHTLCFHSLSMFFIRSYFKKISSLWGLSANRKNWFLRSFPVPKGHSLLVSLEAIDFVAASFVQVGQSFNRNIVVWPLAWHPMAMTGCGGHQTHPEDLGCSRPKYQDYFESWLSGDIFFNICVVISIGQICAWCACSKEDWEPGGHQQHWWDHWGYWWCHGCPLGSQFWQHIVCLTLQAQAQYHSEYWKRHALIDPRTCCTSPLESCCWINVCSLYSFMFNSSTFWTA